MKKLLIVVLILGTLTAMKCDNGVGLETPTPENKFAGGEWERVANENLPMFYLYQKLSFTKKTFTLYEKKQDSEETYTGRYRLFYDTDNNRMIEFISETQKLNGSMQFFICDSQFQHSEYPEGTLYFAYYPPNYFGSGPFSPAVN